MWIIGRARAVCQRRIESGKSLPQVRKDSITAGCLLTAVAEFAEVGRVAGVGDAEVDLLAGRFEQAGAGVARERRAPAWPRRPTRMRPLGPCVQGSSATSSTG